MQEEEEEETKQLTLEEYLAQKKRPGFKKEARAPEALKKENIEKVETGKQKIETISSNIKNAEVHTISTGKTETAQLLGFQGEEEEYPRERGFRGGRGGRGCHRGGFGRPHWKEVAQNWLDIASQYVNQMNDPTNTEG